MEQKGCSKMALREETLAAIIESAKEYRAKKVMLFGSCLYKPEKEAGDIDLAAEMLQGGNIYEFHGDLLLKLHRIAEKNVDMVGLHEDLPVVSSVLEEGVVIYEATK